MAKRSVDCHTPEYTSRIAAFAARCRGEKPAKVTKASKTVKKNKALTVKVVKAKKVGKKKTPAQKLEELGSIKDSGTLLIDITPDATVPA